MKRKTISIIALALCILMAAISLTACGGNKSPLVGTWESVEAPGTSYTFNDDGTGTLDASGVSMKFTYEDKDSTVVITYEGVSTGSTWKYTIHGANLSMEDSDTGTLLTYTKK